MSEFVGISLETLAIPSVLLGIAVVLLLTGKLVPRRTHEDMKEERDHWRQAFLDSEESKSVLLQTLQSLVAAVEQDRGGE